MPRKRLARAAVSRSPSSGAGVADATNATITCDGSSQLLFQPGILRLIVLKILRKYSRMPRESRARALKNPNKYTGTTTRSAKLIYKTQNVKNSPIVVIS